MSVGGERCPRAVVTPDRQVRPTGDQQERKVLGQGGEWRASHHHDSPSQQSSGYGSSDRTELPFSSLSYYSQGRLTK